MSICPKSSGVFNGLRQVRSHSRLLKPASLTTLQPFRFQPSKKVILPPLRSLWRSCAAGPMLGVLEEHQDRVTCYILKKPIRINKKSQVLKCGICMWNHLSSFGLPFKVVFPALFRYFSLHAQLALRVSQTICRNLRWWFAW